MSEQDLVLEPPPPDDEAGQPPPPETPETPESAETETPETPESENPPPVEKPKRSMVSDLQAERTARRQAEQQAQQYQQQLAAVAADYAGARQHPNGVQILQSLVQGQPIAPGARAAGARSGAAADCRGPRALQRRWDAGSAEGRADAQRQNAVAQRAVQAAVQTDAAADRAAAGAGGPAASLDAGASARKRACRRQCAEGDLSRRCPTTSSRIRKCSRWSGCWPPARRCCRAERTGRPRRSRPRRRRRRSSPNRPVAGPAAGVVGRAVSDAF